MKVKITIEDILFVMEPTEPVSILQPVEDDVMDEAFTGSYMNHHVYGPCHLVEGSAIDLYVNLPKCLVGSEVATMESMVTKVNDIWCPCIRVILKPNKVSDREEDLNNYLDDKDLVCEL